ncbi:uncharacterized protein IL334_006116 [Kwoniella shivajii]|uniref:Cysteine-rich transmembrane CYSTM domain-containing protein n=1 Tax=Kwoniella shivajii TaxID=564305 RepID=A0ABZ1D911_9TREE|nr:hypothetical protein IL334_006116 [Kwoniella shivajii]
MFKVPEPTIDQHLYQASDGKWYPRTQMPQGYNTQNGGGGGGYGYGQQPYGQQQPMYPQSQPVYVQQQGGNRGTPGAGMGIFAGLCGALLCFDLGACLF